MQEQAHPATVRAARIERLALLLGFGIGSLAWNVCWPFLPLRVLAVGVDPAQVGQIAGLLAGGANLITAGLGAFWSQLGERFGYRLQILRAHTGTAFSMTLLGLAQTPLALVGSGAMLGLLGGNYPHYMALTASRAAAGEVGRAVGDLQAAGQIGGTIGPLVGGLVAGELGLSAAFYLAGVISLIGTALVLVAVRPDAPGSGERAPVRGSLRQAFARPEQRRLMLLLLAGDAAIQGLRPLIPLVIAARIDDPGSVAPTTGLATTLATGGTVVAALVVGRLSRRVAPRTILLASMPVAIGLVALVPLAPSVPALLAIWALVGLTVGAVTPSIFAWLGRLGAQGGGGYALLATTNMAGFAIGPVVMGQASVYGLDVPFWLAAGLTVIGVALVAATRPEAEEERP